MEVVRAGKVIKHIGMLHPQQCKKALDKRKTIDEIGKWKNTKKARFFPAQRTPARTLFISGLKSRVLKLSCFT